ncbi:hypothetical protein RFI_19150, partial [Reticulomyxa filosa]
KRPNGPRYSYDDEVNTYRGEGKIRFVGEMYFDEDKIYYGVELLDKMGKNSGYHQNVHYFNCAHFRGLFMEEKELEGFNKAPKTATSPDASAKAETEARLKAKAKKQKAKTGNDNEGHSSESEMSTSSEEGGDDQKTKDNAGDGDDNAAHDSGSDQEANTNGGSGDEMDEKEFAKRNSKYAVPDRLKKASFIQQFQRG